MKRTEIRQNVISTLLLFKGGRVLDAKGGGFEGQRGEGLRCKGGTVLGAKGGLF